MSRKRERQIRGYIAGLQIACEVDIAGSGHLRVTMSGPKGSKVIVASKTPSDGRGDLNMFATFRRTARELGCVPA